MPGTKKILIVDDEAGPRFVLRQVLSVAGYRVAEAVDGAAALAACADKAPALVLMDVGMPGMNGFDVVTEMRARGLEMPILMLTARNDVDDRVRGLEVGADDYLVKPCEHRELVARVKALLRRSARQPKRAKSRVIRMGETVVDLQAKRAEHAGAPLALTRTEFGVLEVLVMEAGRPVSREHLLASVWGYAADTQTRTVETHIWRLRKKFRDDNEDPRWLRNCSGIGYTLEFESVAVEDGAGTAEKAALAVA